MAIGKAGMYRQTVHRGGVLAGEAMLASLKQLFSWSWRHDRRGRRLELGYCQKSSLVLEIPAIFAYIDFEGPPDRLQITRTGGPLTGLAITAGRRLARSSALWRYVVTTRTEWRTVPHICQ